MSPSRLTLVPVLALAVGLLVARGTACAAPIVRNYVPPDWQAATINWARDQSPFNHIDDLIDASAADTFDVVINYRKCIEPGDLDRLLQLLPPGSFQRQLKYLPSVSARALTKSMLETLVGAIPEI